MWAAGDGGGCHREVGDFCGCHEEVGGEVIIAEGQFFKMAASRFVDVSLEEINFMKEHAIPRSTKHATKFGMTLFKSKIQRNYLNSRENFAYIDMHE